MKKYIYILGILVVGLASCKKKDVDPGGTNLQSMAGEWWVQIDGEGGYYKISTFNTSENSSTKMWIDFTEFWGDAGATPKEIVQAKVDVNIANKDFSATNATNVPNNNYGDITMTVANGKIVTDGIVAPGSNSKTDAISLDVEFSDDPGEIYKLRGYKKTGFLEDEH